MAKKKQDSSFYNKKVALLREYGVDAQPERDLVTVGLTFNENHLKAIAEGKGMTADEFEASIDALASEDEDADRPGVPKKDTNDAPVAAKSPAKKAASKPKEKEVIPPSAEEVTGPVVDPEATVS